MPYNETQNIKFTIPYYTYTYTILNHSSPIIIVIYNKHTINKYLNIEMK